MAQQSDLAERILDMALELAEDSGWESLNLHNVATRLDISLQQINIFYPQKDDLVEAWFDRADKTVLGEKMSDDFVALKTHERLTKSIMTWFLSMKKHRRVTRQMLYYKFEPGHIHLQVLGIMRISRTVQWFREAALLKTEGVRRVIEEIQLTRIFLFAFARWLFDDSRNSMATERYLAAALQRLSVMPCPAGHL